VTGRTGRGDPWVELMSPLVDEDYWPAAVVALGEQSGGLVRVLLSG
jgi:hypothetical protein